MILLRVFVLLCCCLSTVHAQQVKHGPVPSPVPGATADARKEPAAMRPGEVFKDCADCPEMVLLPAGLYNMGTDDMGGFESEREKIVHRVSVPVMALGKFEVTRGQFAAFVRETGYNAGDTCWTFAGGRYEQRSGRSWRNTGYEQEDSHPVACVNFDDAQAYVEWLAKKTGNPYRLPSEAEWEYAARAGTTTARYWGNDADQACDYANVMDQTGKARIPNITWAIHDCNDGQAYTAPGGRYRPNAFGLHDMIGNVWEWTADCWNESYAGAPDNGSAWTSGDCRWRVLRGGSWISYLQFARSANRGRIGFGLRYDLNGFRVALSPRRPGTE